MDYYTEDDVMLRLALIIDTHSKPKKIGKLIMAMLWRVRIEQRAGLYMILGSDNPIAVIRTALIGYEITPL